ncbi:MAG: hypothetical protein M5R36_19005 [Deltaproteobacteria bacterium]|nr:hypothetical protein [Deltaproteobacteria bacterium]
MNTEGVGFVINRGAVDPGPIDTSEGKPKPGTWQSRLALSLRDVDGDGTERIEDVIAYLEAVPPDERVDLSGLRTVGPEPSARRRVGNKPRGAHRPIP